MNSAYSEDAKSNEYSRCQSNSFVKVRADDICSAFHDTLTQNTTLGKKENLHSKKDAHYFWLSSQQQQFKKYTLPWFVQLFCNP